MRILNNWVNPEVTNTKFACDLDCCKGACCTFQGGNGAPIGFDEVDNLKDTYPIVKKYLPEEHIDIIEKYGIVQYQEEQPSIRCYNERACVFVMYQNDVAICSIQHAYNKHEFHWVKPRSCYLFPIRVHHQGFIKLEYEKFSECHPALHRGKEENIPLISFLEKPLRQEFGDEWFNTLQTTMNENAHDVLREHGV